MQEAADYAHGLVHYEGGRDNVKAITAAGFWIHKAELEMPLDVVAGVEAVLQLVDAGERALAHALVQPFHHPQAPVECLQRAFRAHSVLGGRNDKALGRCAIFVDSDNDNLIFAATDMVAKLTGGLDDIDASLQDDESVQKGCSVWGD